MLKKQHYFTLFPIPTGSPGLLLLSLIDLQGGDRSWVRAREEQENLTLRFHDPYVLPSSFIPLFVHRR